MSDKRLGPVCTDGHGPSARSGRRGTPASRGAFAGALVLLVALAAWPAAAAREGGPRVLWAAGSRLYVAVADSGALAPRMLVRVFDRDREVARGEVVGVLDGLVAGVRLEAPLDPRARLDRLDVLLEPAPARRVATLRVGLPASARRALAPPCAAARLDATALPRAYREETLGAGVVRLVAADSAAVPADSAAAAAWPDTLLVRTFADRADEEIALERGELDVAIFWPGEPSARLRDRASGFELLHGLRGRGAIVADVFSGSPEAKSHLRASVLADLDEVNREFFAGDLLAWWERPGATPPTDTLPKVQSDRSFIGYGVTGLPGGEVLTRFLNPYRSLVSRGTVRVTYEDLLPAEVDSLCRRWSEEDVGRRGTAGGDTRTPPDKFMKGLQELMRASRGDLVPIFALRCPVLCAPARAADVRSLGADAFANLADCTGAGRRP